ncbi:MAG TPA: YdeI/OmpD-associated family protein [Kofleriaceae bacterium]|jgi:hypothetical protein
MARSSHPNKSTQPMPGNVSGALAKKNLMDAFRARPDYQQNGYLKWIATAAGPAAKQQRLDQMLDELQQGGLFQGESWTPPAKS